MNPQLPSQIMHIIPITHPLNASVRIPGSKSLTNRALLIAALAQGKTRLINALFSDDSGLLVTALQNLGFMIFLDPVNGCMEIQGLGGSIPKNQVEIFIGNAGTAARFLTAFLTLGHGTFIVDGDSRMRERPIGDLVDALTQLGANVQADNRYGSLLCPPVKINASGLPGGKTKIAGNISSQFLSALLMTTPYAKTPVEIEITTTLNSKPYIDMTLAIMSDFGIDVERDGYNSFLIQPGIFSPISEYSIEPDATSASYFFAAPAICGGTVCVDGLSFRSIQGDIKFLDILARMGCAVEENKNSIKITGASELVGMDIDMSDIPDTAQTLAAVAPFAISPTRIRGIGSARVKETDRISAVCAELRKIGVGVYEHEDGMTIFPCSQFNPAVINTYNDHRMAMAFSLIGLRVPGISIDNPGCVSKTFPDFFNIQAALR
jgi:3-phosphoshikimate 1-carboxyvinyltransferase